MSSAVETLFFITNHIDPYLGNNKQESLVKVCRIAKNLEGDPIEYRESYGLAGKFSYEINIRDLCTNQRPTLDTNLKPN